MENGRTDPSTRRHGARPRLFISYRRRFDSASARLLKTDLDKAFGEDFAFLDVTGIRPGEDFPESIREALESCDVFLALISHGWLGVVNELKDPDDFIRREIAVALARRVTLIPVLLGDARMPEPKELPEEIRDLAFRNAIRLSDDRWNYDVARLVGHVGARTGLRRPDSFFDKLFRSFSDTPRRKAVTSLAVIAAVLFAGVFGLGYAIRRWFTRPDFNACVRANTPGGHGAETKVMLGANDSVFVKTNEYGAALTHPGASEGVPLVLRLSDSGHEVGAVFFRFFRADKVDDSIFKVEKVLAPPCEEVQDYTNYSLPANDRSVLKNWNRLAVRLGGRDYFVRPDDRGEYVTVRMEPVPGDAQLPWN